jgi:arylsulfatase A-like enzyme
MLAPMQQWISASREPFLMVTVTSAAHDPYEVPAEFARPATAPADRYVQAVRYGDHFLRQLCEVLNKQGLTGNTILCVMGDHGTSFRACGSDSRWVPYEEVIRVPWIIRWPGHLQPKRVTWPCSQLDVLPTLLGLLNAPLADAPLAGRDALQPCEEQRRIRFSSWYTDGPRGYTESMRKMVWWPRTGMVVAYDLQTDPNEESPTVIAGPAREAVIADMIRWRKQWRIEFPYTHVAESLLYDHWRTFCSGRLAWSYYIP